MKFGQKISGGSSFGQKIQAGASKLFHKYGDIARTVSNLGFVTGGALSGFGQAELSAPIIALSTLVSKGGNVLSGLGSALERNHHNRLA
jgi:hypothetical protein